MRKKIFLTAAMALLASAAASAQYSGYEPPRWRVNGFAGFDLTHTSQSLTTSDNSTDQLFPLGDLRLNSDGYVLDPRFLHLTTGFDFQKGVNSAERGDLSTGGTNIAISSALLPNSHFPFRVSYTRTDHGVSGLGFDQSEDTSRLDLQWTVFHPKLPHLTTSFQMYGSTVHVPQSFSDRNYDQKALSLAISDNWKRWNWTGNFSLGNGDSTGISQLGLDSSFTNNTRAGGFNLNRTFWEQKAHLMFENRDIWRKDSLAGDGASKSSEFTNNAIFDVQLNPKVLVGASYAFSKISFEGDGLTSLLLPGAGQISVVSLVSSTANSASGRVDYRPWNWLRLTEELRSTFSTPAVAVAESRTSFTESDSTIAADHRWHGFDLAGSYTGRFQIAGTTLDRAPNSWSNSFTGRIGWGDARRLRLIASGEDLRLNLVEQIGGFTDQKRAALEAETHWVRRFRLRAGGEYSNVELLNLSGNTRNKTVAYSVSGEHRLFAITYSKSFVDGAGALFPLGLIDQQFLVIPLPISQLIATPLLNRKTHAQTVSFLAKPRRNLEARVSWRTEDTQLAASDQTFDVIQADARYRLGKFTLEGGYWRNINDVTVITGLTGNRLALWYFRIGRDFRIL
ncbi:MAG TPA: hypothetical protein VF532_08495 [Candidatus Angelobacter sp.]